MRKGFWLWLAVVVTAVGSVAYAAALPMDFSPAPAAAEQNYLSDHADCSVSANTTPLV